MRGNEYLCSFAFFAAVTFFCAGAYYLHTGILGALLAMVGIGLCTTALVHRCAQQYFSAQEERQQERKVSTEQRAQHLNVQLQQIAGQLKELNEIHLSLLPIQERYARSTERSGEHLALLAEWLIEKNKTSQQLEAILQKLRRILQCAEALQDEVEDLGEPIRALGAPLTEALEGVIADLRKHSEIQELTMEQYQSMTAKDMELLTQLTRSSE
jgi:hypothetical protein